MFKLPKVIIVIGWVMCLELDFLVHPTTYDPPNYSRSIFSTDNVGTYGPTLGGVDRCMPTCLRAIQRCSPSKGGNSCRGALSFPAYMFWVTYRFWRTQNWNNTLFHASDQIIVFLSFFLISCITKNNILDIQCCIFYHSLGIFPSKI
jgi:hypothetical protein